jgi:UDP-N-acetylmuramyl pentapeptide phosphotransferase/UDP-N-acetylglucosamine-1-phosphate transferase
MSPSRAQARRAPARHTHSRREIVTAVLGGAGVVVFTVVAIWLLRPGGSTPGTGGIAHRQPRATWLVGISLLAVIVGTIVVLRSRKLRRRAKALLPTIIASVLVVAVVVGFVWPGGLLRHPVSFSAPPPGTAPSTDAAPTTAPSTTATTGG